MVCEPLGLYKISFEKVWDYDKRIKGFGKQISALQRLGRKAKNIIDIKDTSGRSWGASNI